MPAQPAVMPSCRSLVFRRKTCASPTGWWKPYSTYCLRASCCRRPYSTYCLRASCCRRPRPRYCRTGSGGHRLDCLGGHGVSVAEQREENRPGRADLEGPFPSPARQADARASREGQCRTVEGPIRDRTSLRRYEGTNGLFLRTIGIDRARARIGMANIAFNMKRLLFRERKGAVA